jgi:hypothetical protein
LKKFNVLLLIPLMLLGAFLVPANVHAATGQISVNGGSTITVASSATTVSVPIQVANSAGFNGFQIIVVADPSILSASSIDLTGSVLPSPSILAECINGVLVAGTSCGIQAGVAGTVELAAGGGSPPGSQSTTNPVSGLIFTINYNIVGQTGGTPISFQTGCSSTSTGNSDCVQIASSGTTVPETDLGATFINQVDFSQTATFANLSTPSGTSISDVINYATIGPYSDLVGETVAVSPASGLSCTLHTGSVDLSSSSTGSDTLNCSATANGSYSVTVTACGELVFTCPPATPHHVTISVLVAAAGFSLSLNPTSLQISRGNSKTSVITISSFSGFSSAVSFSASSTQSGVTGSAPSATPATDASGYGTGTSTLTVAVASSVPTGVYTLSVTGMGGSVTSAPVTLTVNVPNQQYTVNAVPNSITILRGGSAAFQIVLTSFGAFTGTASFTGTTSPIAGQQDSCCLTNNITPFFSQNSIVLPPDGTAQVTFFASTVGAVSPSTETSTGNYTGTVSVSINGVPLSVNVNFNLIDFSVGPTFCTGSNLVATSESDFGSLDSPQFLNDTFAGIFIGGACNTLTITSQPNILPLFLGGGFFGEVPNAQALYIKTNAFGGINTGLTTNGFNGVPAIGFINNQIPSNGVAIPQLAVDFPVNGTNGFTWPSAACLLPTFWANGTQIPYSYLAQNGPLVIPGSGVWAFFSTLFHHHPPVPIVPPGALGNWGCKFDATAWPNDAGVFNPDPATGTGDCTHPGSATSDDCGNGVHVARYNNPDYSPIVAMAIQGTKPGLYSFQICGQNGVLQHCQTLGLNVVTPPNVHQFVAPKSVSFSQSGGVVTFKLGIDNPYSQTVYVQNTVTAVGSLGDTLTATTAVLTIGPGGAANNVFLSFQLTRSMIGETFTFSQSMAVGTDPVNLNGTSSVTSNSKATGTFRVTA